MKQIIIKEGDSGQRLDKYLGKYLKEAPKSFLYKMMRKKNITLNGKKAQGNEILKAMDEIPKECLFSPKVLTLTDLPIATGGYSTITFHKCSEKNFIVAQKTVAITQNFNDTIKSEFIYPYHLKYPTILRPFGVMDPKLNGYKVQILSRYMPGGTVWEMIQKERHKTAPSMWDGTRKSIVFYGIVKAIDFVNKQHFLHLDVKSDNVILDSNLEPYLMDFTLLSPQKDKGMKLMDQGNPIFQAPEAKNKQFDVENDWYGLGLLRYQMETLDNPFHDLPTQALWYAKETGKKFSQNTTSLTSQLMNPDPKKRPSPELVASLKTAETKFAALLDEKEREKRQLESQLNARLMSLNSDLKAQAEEAHMNVDLEMKHVIQTLIHTFPFLYDGSNELTIDLYEKYLSVLKDKFDRFTQKVLMISGLLGISSKQSIENAINELKNLAEKTEL